jgi:uncharacterized protein involved in type VI secretion and phage assembly
MIERWREAQRLHAASMDGQRGEPRYGIVSSTDPVRCAVRVNYQPSGALSGWLQLPMPWVGSGWGMLAMPPIGAQVVVMPVEGDAEQCVVVGVTFNDQDQPPSGYPNGEFWLVHQSGSFLKLQNDGTVQVKGDLHVNGDVYDKHGSLDRLRGHYNQHVHPGVQTGGGNTLMTTQQDPE